MNFPSRQVEFIFSQTAPAVCLPCKQTDFTKRIIALFRVLLYRVSSKKLLKIENTRSNQFELEFSFSFDHQFDHVNSKRTCQINKRHLNKWHLTGPLQRRYICQPYRKTHAPQHSKNRRKLPQYSPDAIWCMKIRSHIFHPC